MANKYFHTASQGLSFRGKERVFPTGCRLLNTAFGCFDPITGLPGIPAATVLEVFGPNASLKTALWESTGGNIHAMLPESRILAILPEEPDYSRFLDHGIDLDRIDCWTYYNPNNPDEIVSAEEGLDMALEAVSDPRSNYSMVVVDSIKALMSDGEVFNKKGDLKSLAEVDPVAARAKLMNRFFGGFAAYNKARAILFGVNQISESIGPSYLTGGSFKTKTSGGRGKEHWAKLRIECNSTVPDATEKPEEHGVYKNKIYDVIKPIYYIEKNKYGFPFRKVISEFSLNEKRFLNENNCLDVAVFLDLIQKNGKSHYVLNGETVQGKEAARAYLHSHPEYQDKLWREIDKRHVEFFGAGKKTSKESLDE